MLKEYAITNFKAFAETEVIPIKPITLIFGPNSSGKSSVIQSLLMLKQTLDEARDTNVVLLPQGRMVNLGNFREFIHCHDILKDFSIKMTFSTPIGIEKILDKITLEFDLNNNITIPLGILLADNKFNEFGLKIYFSSETKNIVVTKIDLFIGDETMPVGSYFKTDTSIPVYKFQGNFEHNYWKFYFETLHAHDPKFMERVTGRDISEALESRFKAEISKEVWEKLGRIEVIQKKLETAKLIEQIHKLQGFEQAVEAYKEIVFKYDSIQLKNFLPQYESDMEQNQDALISLVTQFVSELIRSFFQNIIYIAPLRNKPERYYIYSGQNPKDVGYSGEMTPDVLFSNNEILTAVNEQFDKLGIGYEIQIPRLSDENGNIKDVFALQLKHKSTGIIVNSLSDVGFGVGQVFPIVVQSMFSKERTLLIEQPELHLHPALQAELGDMFIRSALGTQKNTFIIETHSEHLILRLLRRIREVSGGEEISDDIPRIKPDDISVLYVKPTKEGAKIFHIPVNKEGDFNINWPEGFFPERAKELF